MIQYFCQIYKTCVIPGHMFLILLINILKAPLNGGQVL